MRKDKFESLQIIQSLSLFETQLSIMRNKMKDVKIKIITFFRRIQGSNATTVAIFGFVQFSINLKIYAAFCLKISLGVL